MSNRRKKKKGKKTKKTTKKTTKKKPRKKPSPLKKSPPKIADELFINCTFFLDKAYMLEDFLGLDALRFECPESVEQMGDNIVTYNLQNLFYYNGFTKIWYLNCVIHYVEEQVIYVNFTTRNVADENIVDDIDFTWKLEGDMSIGCSPRPLYQWYYPRKDTIEWFRKYPDFTSTDVKKMFDAWLYRHQNQMEIKYPAIYEKVGLLPIHAKLLKNHRSTLDKIWKKSDKFNLEMSTVTQLMPVRRLEEGVEQMNAIGNLLLTLEYADGSKKVVLQW